jgi:hypothetical protein
MADKANTARDWRLLADDLSIMEETYSVSSCLTRCFGPNPIW